MCRKNQFNNHLLFHMKEIVKHQFNIHLLFSYGGIFSCVLPLIIPRKIFFTKLNFLSCVPPHLKSTWMKNLITTCFFHVDEFLGLRFYFSEKSLFCEIQYGRCLCGCWRQMPFCTILTW